MSNLTYANFVPLIGGLSLAIKQELGGQKPLYNISYDVFAKNEFYFYNYEKGVPTYIFEKNDSLTRIKNEVSKYGTPDIIGALCPCGGLSLLNNTSARGSNSETNCWMRYFANLSFQHIKPKAIFMENAPSLYDGSMAEDLRQFFEAAAKKGGYSIQYVKTDTRFAGIPQQRKRTYLMAFRDGYGGMKLPEKIPMKYLDDVVGNDTIGKPLTDLSSSPFYKYMIKTIGKDFRDVIINDVIKKQARCGMLSVLTYVMKYQNKSFDVLKPYGDDKFKSSIDRLMGKLADNKGFWDYSPLICIGQVNAVIVKNAIRTIHPTEDRYFTNREIMRLMGMPEDMEPPPADQYNIICQNTPVNTSQRMFRVVKNYLEAKDSDKIKGSVIRADDFKDTIVAVAQ